MTDALWYLGRATGMTALVLLSAVLVLGITTRAGRPALGLPRFVAAALHRTTSMLALSFVVVHVVTLLVDPYAQLDALALVVPFTAAQNPFAYGLGALASDLLVAVMVTSLLRHRIGPRTWRAVHWAAYACWPIAAAHALTAGSDAATGWMLTTLVACVIAVATAIGWRVSERFGPADRPQLPGRVLR